MPIDVEDFEEDEARNKFAEIPDDRTFYTLKLFVGEDGSINGGGYHDGRVLKDLGFGPARAAAAETIGDATTEAAQRALSRIVPMLGYGQLLDSIIQPMIAKEEEKHSDDNQDRSTEGSTAAAGS